MKCAAPNWSCRSEKLAEAKRRGEKLAGLTVQIVQKAGVDGKLFGSVTNADIVAALEAQGFEVEKSQVRMPEGHLKQIGDYPFNMGLHTDVVVGITVVGARRTVIQPERPRKRSWLTALFCFLLFRD